MFKYIGLEVDFGFLGSFRTLIIFFRIIHPSVEKDLSLKIDERDQTIWKSTLEF